LYAIEYLLNFGDTASIHRSIGDVPLCPIDDSTDPVTRNETVGLHFKEKQPRNNTALKTSFSPIVFIYQVAQDL